MKSWLVGLLWVLCLIAPVEGSPEAGARMGINLSGPCDWNTELPFVDVFRMSRRWISQRRGADWGQGPDLSLDAHGWVTELASDCWAETPLCTITGGHYPSGHYTVLYDGLGCLKFSKSVTVVSSTSGRMVIDVDSSKGGFFLKITKTDPEDYIRNIRVIMPGFEKIYKKNPWHPDFLKRWQHMSCLRFMDWMETNNSTISSWEQRPTMEDATFAKRGVPFELMIDLANRLKVSPWFCMPHQADDEFVRRAAMLVRDHLDPSLTIYLEYSNELWNGMFKQSKWTAEQGLKFKLAKTPWEATWHYTALRSVQIFAIWEEVFGGSSRLVRILPSQAANPYISKRIAHYHNAYKHADALAIAPYISFNIPKQHRTLPADTVAGWRVGQVIDHLEHQALPKALSSIQQQKKVAETYGLKLIAYEAGQHMVGVAGGENNEVLTALLASANRHPRMKDIYEAYFKGWEAAGGELICHFSSVSRWSKWGSWGLLEYADDDPESSPKFQAVVDWFKKKK